MTSMFFSPAEILAIYRIVWWPKVQGNARFHNHFLNRVVGWKIDLPPNIYRPVLPEQYYVKDVMNRKWVQLGPGEKKKVYLIYSEDSWGIRQTGFPHFMWWYILPFLFSIFLFSICNWGAFHTFIFTPLGTRHSSMWLWFNQKNLK